MLVISAILVSIVLLILLGRWTDQKGWTRFHNFDRHSVGDTISVFDEMFNAERKKAVEYRIAERRDFHGSQQKSGDDKEL